MLALAPLLPLARDAHLHRPPPWHPSSPTPPPPPSGLLLLLLLLRSLPGVAGCFTQADTTPWARISRRTRRRMQAIFPIAEVAIAFVW